MLCNGHAQLGDSREQAWKSSCVMTFETYCGKALWQKLQMTCIVVVTLLLQNCYYKIGHDSYQPVMLDLHLFPSKTAVNPRSTMILGWIWSSGPSMLALTELQPCLMQHSWYCGTYEVLLVLTNYYLESFLDAYTYYASWCCGHRPLISGRNPPDWWSLQCILHCKSHTLFTPNDHTPTTQRQILGCNRRCRKETRDWCHLLCN